MTAKVDDYYGFVIRRLAASGNLPAGFRAEIPQAPPLRARPSDGGSPEAAPGAVPVGPAGPAVAAFDSASASRQTQAE